jgi:serine/threonine-protein phosphatase 5
MDEKSLDLIFKAYKEGKDLHYKYVLQILCEFELYLKKNILESLIEITVPKDTLCVVVGDIHGQLPDFLTIMGKYGKPSEKLFYLFNGDFVDRGILFHKARTTWN